MGACLKPHRQHNVRYKRGKKHAVSPFFGGALLINSALLLGCDTK